MPDIGNIDHETVNTVPANRSRTRIPVRESVTLSINEASWEDMDDVIGPEGNMIGEEADAIGVNFTGIQIREVVAQQTFQWPSGGKYVVIAADKAVTPGDQTIPAGTYHNCFLDLVSTGGPWDIGYLATPTGPANALFSPTQDLYFQIGDSPVAWQSFMTNIQHPRAFAAGTYNSLVGWGGATGVVAPPILRTVFRTATSSLSIQR